MQTRGFLKEPDQCICFLRESSSCVNIHREAPRRCASCSITAPANAQENVFLRTRARQRAIIYVCSQKPQRASLFHLNLQFQHQKWSLQNPIGILSPVSPQSSPHPHPLCSTVTKAPSPSSSCENAQRERRRLFGPATPARYGVRRVNKTPFSSSMQK